MYEKLFKAEKGESSYKSKVPVGQKCFFITERMQL